MNRSEVRGLGEPRRQVLGAVEKVLGDVLGEHAKKAVLLAIELDDATLEDAYRDPERFMGALEEIFGSAARTLEKMFVKELSRHFTYLRPDRDGLKEAVAKIKQRSAGRPGEAL